MVFSFVSLFSFKDICIIIIKDIIKQKNMERMVITKKELQVTQKEKMKPRVHMKETIRRLC
jgi:hypothetical protein